MTKQNENKARNLFNTEATRVINEDNATINFAATVEIANLMGTDPKDVRWAINHAVKLFNEK